MPLLNDKQSPHESAATIRRPSGLDAAGAVMVANTVNRFSCRILVRCGNRVASGHSIMDLILLNGCFQEELVFEAVGEEGAQATEALRKLVEEDFGLE